MIRLVLALSTLAALALPVASTNAEPAGGPCLPPGITTPPGAPKLPPCKKSTPGQQPGAAFVARYHLSGYGVFHEKWLFTYTAAPCREGGHGGGTDGVIENVSTIRWETVRPATVTVQGIDGQPPAMLPALDPATQAPGAVATVTVTSKTTDDRKRIACDLSGNPVVGDEPGKADRTQCGTHTYAAGYYMGTQWPTVQKHPGERIAVGVVPLPATGKQLQVDWAKCWDMQDQIDSQDAAEISAPLPFAHLPRAVRGKLSVIAHGSKVRLDAQEPQNTGGTSHYHADFNGTSYVTWIRIG